MWPKTYDMSILDTRDALLAMAKKCGEWPNLFATVVTDAKNAVGHRCSKLLL